MDIPYLFNYIQICALSNGMETRLVSFIAGYEFFFEWLEVENEKENPAEKRFVRTAQVWSILLPVCAKQRFCLTTKRTSFFITVAEQRVLKKPTILWRE